MSGRKPSTIGGLKAAGIVTRPVKQEVRENLLRRLSNGETLFPGIVGYERTVVPGIVNALLAQHDFILLGLRGQAKTRILRALTTLLDEEIPVVAGSELNDNPFGPPPRVPDASWKRKGTTPRLSGSRGRRATTRNWRRRM